MGGLFDSKPREVTSTSRVELAPEQRRLISLATPFLEQFAESPPPLDQQSTVPGFNPTQMQAQQTALDAAGTQAGVVGNAAGANNFLLSGALLDPQSNPALGGVLDSAIRPLIQNYESSVLPSIRGQAESTGNFSSSRRGIAEGIAARGLTDSIGDVTSSVVNNQFNQGLSALVRGLGLAPQTAQSQAFPASTQSAVGDTRYNLEQAQLREANRLQNLQDYYPLLIGQDILRSSGMIPSAGTSVTSPIGSEPSPFQNILGMGSLGASLFGPVGAAGGAGLGALFSFL